MKKIIVILSAIILIAAACNKSNTATNSSTDNTSQNSNASDSSNQTNPTPTPTPTPVPTPAPTPAATQSSSTIHITSSGFTPNTITIKAGTTVTFINDSSKASQPASDPHPTHTDYPGFDPKRGLQPGSSWSFTFNKVGTWGYHDHLNSSKSGTITVTQ